jgi:hypothetical protein
MTQPMDDSMVVAIRSRSEPTADDGELLVKANETNEPAEPGLEPPAQPPEWSVRTQASDVPANVTPLGSVYAAPFGFVLRATVNRARRSVPVVIDDPDQLEAMARGLELVAGNGGFEAHASSTCRIEARIRLSGARALSAAASIRALSGELLDLASDALPAQLILREPLELELCTIAEDALLVCLGLSAPADQQLENALYGAACAVAPVLSRLAGVTPNVRVTRQVIDHFRVRCRIDAERLIDAALETAGPLHAEQLEEQAVQRAVAALAAGERQRAVAAAHNGIVASGVAAVALALGNAPARVIAGAKRHAQRNGGCQPLCAWRAVGDEVHGELELPLGITTHGRWHPPEAAAEAARPQLSPALDIGLLAACVGMAASVVALMDAVRVRLDDAPERISGECATRRCHPEAEPPSVASL